jgi:hypothetical protein
MKVWEIINEHRMVWKRTPSGTVAMKWRCETGQRAGRTVPSVNDCSKPLDVAQAQKMKKTRAQTKLRQARKSKKTKRVNPASKLTQRLNKQNSKKR